MWCLSRSSFLSNVLFPLSLFSYLLICLFFSFHFRSFCFIFFLFFSVSIIRLSQVNRSPTSHPSMEWRLNSQLCFLYFKLAKLENWSIIWPSYLFLSITPRHTQIHTSTNTQTLYVSHTRTHRNVHSHSLSLSHTHTHAHTLSHGGSPNWWHQTTIWDTSTSDKRSLKILCLGNF